MASEKYPATTFLRNAFKDPATHKLLSTLTSGLLIYAAVQIRDWQAWPFLGIFVPSILFSAFSLYLICFKKESVFEECPCLKWLFLGRTILWDEFQTTAALAFAIANLCGVMAYREMEYHLDVTYLSLITSFLYGLQWFLGSQKDIDFVLDENLNLTRTCFRCVIGVFNRFPIFFSLIRSGCLIGALTLLIISKYAILAWGISFYMYCIAAAILASLLLFLLQASKTLNNMIGGKSVLGRKRHTYLLVAIVFFSASAVFTFSILTEERKTGDEYFVHASMFDYQNLTVAEYYRQRSEMEKIRSTPLPPQLTTWYWLPRPIKVSAQAPYFDKIPFALLCAATVLAFLDLYSRAVQSQSRRIELDVTDPLQGIMTEKVKNIEFFPIASPSQFSDFCHQTKY